MLAAARGGPRARAASAFTVAVGQIGLPRISHQQAPARERSSSAGQSRARWASEEVSPRGLASANQGVSLPGAKSGSLCSI